ncbi:MAG TPA: UDP-glucuronic acid decarboxylase family protein [Gammaproteobacteria bacterium]
MRILVAGGAGFLGSHLCSQLVRRGHFVYCMDDLSTGRLVNVAALRRSPRFVFVPRSVLEPLWLPVDLIYNLASPASPVHYQADPELTLRTNVEGTRQLLKLAEETGAHLVYASTSEVYGDPTEHPQHEDYLGNVNTMGPRSCYDEGKRCAETLCYLYRQRGVPASVVRIFNTYGPGMRMDDGRAVSNLLTQALRGEPLTVYGDGSQTRSFCYVDDMVDALCRLLGKHSGLAGPLNLGNPEEVTVLALANLVLALTGSKSTIAFKPLPVDDPARRCPDISRAKRLLGWSPGTPLREGLDRTMRYFRRELQEGDGRSPSAAIVA